MTRILTIANNKGGCGKTATATALAAGLAEQGKSILLIDTDAQANTTMGMRIPTTNVDCYSLLQGKQMEPVQIAANLWAVGATLNMNVADRTIETMEQGTAILDMLQQFMGKYDYIVIDTPPTLGLLTINAIYAADYVLIPLQASFYALQGMGNIIELLQKFGKADKYGIIVTMYESRKTLHKHLHDTICNSYGQAVYSTKVRNNIAIGEAPARGMSLFEYAPKSNGAADYRAVIVELLQRIDK